MYNPSAMYYRPLELSTHTELMQLALLERREGLRQRLN